MKEWIKKLICQEKDGTWIVEWNDGEVGWASDKIVREKYKEEGGHDQTRPME